MAQILKKVLGTSSHKESDSEIAGRKEVTNLKIFGGTY